MSNCCSGEKTVLMYSCSGAADLGSAADRTARFLNQKGYAKMSCLAGVGAGLSGFVESAKGADCVITIDGCAVACARKSIERIGAANISSYILTDMGYVKGETVVTDTIVKDIAERICAEKEKTISQQGPKCSCGGTC